MTNYSFFNCVMFNVLLLSNLVGSFGLFFLPFKNNFLNVCSHCLVVGDRQKHLACLLTVKAVLDPATLEVTSSS